MAKYAPLDGTFIRKDFLTLRSLAYLQSIRAMREQGSTVETISSALGLTVDELAELLSYDTPEARLARKKQAQAFKQKKRTSPKRRK